MTPKPPDTAVDAAIDEILAKIIDYVGGNGTATEFTIKQAKAKLKALMVAERLDELEQVNKVNNSIYSDDPAAYYVNIQRHINNRQAALTAQQPTGGGA